MSRRRERWLTCVRKNLPLIVLCCLGIGYSPAPLSQLSSNGYENIESVQTTDILPDAELQSGHFRVRDQVLVERDSYKFEIDSSYGVYRLHTLPMLAIRTRELRTLAQAISQYKLNDDAFAERLRGQLTVNAYSLVDVVTAPFNMVEQFAKNFGQTAQELRNFTIGQTHSSAPAYLNGISNDIIGGTHKRNAAYQLGLDPYSTNPKVQEFLNTIAQARSSGHFSAGVATIRIPASQTVDIADGRLDAQIRTLVKNLSPEELNDGIDAQLQLMGVNALDREDFTNHPQFSPSHKTAITAYLDYVRGIDNREIIIRAALTTKSETEALSYEILCKMLARYHESIEPVATLEFLADLLIAISSTNRVLVLMSVDLVQWDQRTEQIFGTLSRRLSMEGHVYPELIVTGSLTDKSRRGLDLFGFSYREHFLTRI